MEKQSADTESESTAYDGLQNGHGVRNGAEILQLPFAFFSSSSSSFRLCLRLRRPKTAQAKSVLYLSTAAVAAKRAARLTLPSFSTLLYKAM